MLVDMYILKDEYINTLFMIIHEFYNDIGNYMFYYFTLTN